jgi:hypothetical protein
MLKKGILVAMIVGVLSCGGWLLLVSSPSRDYTEDAWYTPQVPGEDAGWRLQSADRLPFVMVRAEAHSLACNMLASESVRCLEPNEAEYLLGGTLTCPDARPYLARGLGFVSGTAEMSVYSRNGALYVIGGALGSGAPEAVRRPIVVWLKSRPTRVYVGLSVCK